MKQLSVAAQSLDGTTPTQRAHILTRSRLS
jgi:hypothetical protein